MHHHTSVPRITSAAPRKGAETTSEKHWGKGMTERRSSALMTAWIISVQEEFPINFFNLFGSREASFFKRNELMRNCNNVLAGTKSSVSINRNADILPAELVLLPFQHINGNTLTSCLEWPSGLNNMTLARYLIVYDIYL
uniref:Uncharacterized protein n=1 Tax=Onchocerca volvulus TaxID=6282 RepID=A0A8R1Y2G1_ONCVO